MSLVWDLASSKNYLRTTYYLFAYFPWFHIVLVYSYVSLEIYLLTTYLFTYVLKIDC